jgi:casein kinase 1
MTTNIIDNYVFNKEKDLLGEGNFGIVMRAKTLEYDYDYEPKAVALKIEKEDCEEEKSLIQHEAQVLLSLKGCNGIPRLIKYGNYFGFRYLITPLFKETLTERIKKRNVSSLEILVYRKKLKEIIDNIHKRGFIHRDIKPDNIMFDENDKIYLIDFGCATRYIGSKITQTSSGNYVGTLSFLGENGKKGMICKEVDYEGLDKTITFCINNIE